VEVVIPRSLYSCGATVCQSVYTAFRPLAFACCLRAARDSSRGNDRGRTAPSLAARSVALLLGTCVCLGTQRTLTTPS
jgi:hypothetical protein